MITVALIGLTLALSDVAHAGPPSLPPPPSLRADRPLAIPAQPPSAMSPELGRALREYRQDHLRVQRLVGYRLGTFGYTERYWSPYSGWGWGTTVYAPTVTQTEGWAVFQGAERLDVPTYLARIGATEEKTLLERKIRRKRTLASVLYAVGGAGAIATVAGLVGMDGSQTADDYYTWGAVSTAGLSAMVVGFVGGSYPTATARALEWVPAVSRPLEAVEQEVNDHNERLADELGLSPAQALQVEEQTR